MKACKVDVSGRWETKNRRFQHPSPCKLDCDNEEADTEKQKVNPAKAKKLKNKRMRGLGPWRVLPIGTSATAEISRPTAA
jgi:hypothetical protein